MSYEDIRIEGSLTDAMEAWVARPYGTVVDIEITGINEGNYAAVGYAAVENTEAGTVEAVVLLLQHDPEVGPDSHHSRCEEASRTSEGRKYRSQVFGSDRSALDPDN
jgi:hypothetical protein